MREYKLEEWLSIGVRLVALRVVVSKYNYAEYPTNTPACQ